MNLKLRSVVIMALIIDMSSVIYAQHDKSKLNMEQDDHGTMDHKSNMVKLNDKDLTKAYILHTMKNEDLVGASSEKAQKASKMLVRILNKYGKAPEAEKVATSMASKSNII